MFIIFMPIIIEFYNSINNIIVKNYYCYKILYIYFIDSNKLIVL
jgi:hypothetical protein